MAVLVALIAAPLLEIAGFVVVGDRIGLLATLALVLLAALAGTVLLRAQPFQVVTELRTASARGEAPVRPLFDAVCRVIAGVLLIVPGFVGDLFALLLLAPPVRELVYRWLHRRIAGGAGPAAARDQAARPRVIEAEWRELDGDEPPQPPTSSLPPSSSHWGSPNSKYRS
ncbi:MAG TPA: FxsA family protein [Azospirillaceae bacterium]|nr:FxsA family protein [Azospirillaceae bacterium]